MMRAKQNKWKRHTRYPICQDFLQESEGIRGVVYKKYTFLLCHFLLTRISLENQFFKNCSGLLISISGAQVNFEGWKCASAYLKLKLLSYEMISYLLR